MLKTVLKNAPIVQLPVDSNEAFSQVNRIFRSIMQEADIESYNPNDFFKLEIKKLQDRGIIKTNAKISLATRCPAIGMAFTFCFTSTLI